MKFRIPEASYNSAAEIEKPNMDRAYQKALQYLDHDKIDISRFSSIYTKDVIEADLERVAEIKSKFEKDPNIELEKEAVVLEAILHHQIENNEWFGPGVNTIRPLEFDDYVNGIDDIIEFTEKGSAEYIGLAIDATASADVEKKLKRIKEEIEAGVLPEIKYFHSPHLGVTGIKHDIPRVIIEVHHKTIEQVTQLWLANKNGQLSKHPLQIQLLREIEAQLEFFEQYALRLNKTAVAEAYGKARVKIAAVLKTKASLVKELEYESVSLDDGSNFNIRHTMTRVFGNDILKAA